MALTCLMVIPRATRCAGELDTWIAFSRSERSKLVRPHFGEQLSSCFFPVGSCVAWQGQTMPAFRDEISANTNFVLGRKRGGGSFCFGAFSSLFGRGLFRLGRCAGRRFLYPTVCSSCGGDGSLLGILGGRFGFLRHGYVGIRVSD